MGDVWDALLMLTCFNSKQKTLNKVTLRQNLPTLKGKNSSLQAKILFYESSDIMGMILYVLAEMLGGMGIAMPIIVIMVLALVELETNSDNIDEIDEI